MKNEKIEEITKNTINKKGFQHTLKLVPSSQRELFVSEIEKHLLRIGQRAQNTYLIQTKMMERDLENL